MSKGYSPMVVKFFMLQSHYRSTLDLTDEALQAAEKGYKRLMEAHKTLKKLTTTGISEDAPINAEIRNTVAAAYADMDDDFNTPKALSQLFSLVSTINSLADKKIDIKTVSAETLDLMKSTFEVFLDDIFGLKNDLDGGDNGLLLDGLMDLIKDALLLHYHICST